MGHPLGKAAPVLAKGFPKETPLPSTGSLGFMLSLIPYVKKRQAHSTGALISQGHCNVTGEALGSKSDFWFFSYQTGNRAGWYGHFGKQPGYSL